MISCLLCLLFCKVNVFRHLQDTYDADVSKAFASCPKLQAWAELTDSGEVPQIPLQEIVANVEKNEGIQKWVKERQEDGYFS